MTHPKYITATPEAPADSDPLYREQWALHKMDAEKAWQCLDKVPSWKPVTVAIVDCGIQCDHQDLDKDMVIGHCVIPPDYDDFSDDDGHGTMLAGTIGAVAGNGRGGRGVVPKVRLMAVKFIDVRTPPMTGNAVKAIKYAVEHGAKIINASWDVGLNNPKLQEVIEYAGSKGVLVVVAAGNDGSDIGSYLTCPASYAPLDNMISVMATDKNDGKPGFSNYGDKVDIAAPGVNIVSTVPYLCRPPTSPRSYGPAYRSYSGTSASAAHVSGAAALLLSINPGLKPKEIRERLIASVTDVPDLHRYCLAGGRLNLHRAVERVVNEAR